MKALPESQVKANHNDEGGFKRRTEKWTAANQPDDPRATIVFFEKRCNRDVVEAEVKDNEGEEEALALPFPSFHYLPFLLSPGVPVSQTSMLCLLSGPPCWSEAAALTITTPRKRNSRQQRINARLKRLVYCPRSTPWRLPA